MKRVDKFDNTPQMESFHIIEDGNITSHEARTFKDTSKDIFDEVKQKLESKPLSLTYPFHEQKPEKFTVCKRSTTFMQEHYLNNFLLSLYKDISNLMTDI